MSRRARDGDGLRFRWGMRGPSSGQAPSWTSCSCCSGRCWAWRPTRPPVRRIMSRGHCVCCGSGRYLWWRSRSCFSSRDRCGCTSWNGPWPSRGRGTPRWCGAEVLTAPGAAVPPDTTVEQAPEETGPGGRGRTAVPGPAADRIPAHWRRYGRTIDLTHGQAFTSLNGARPWKPRRGDSGFNGIDRRRSRSGRRDRTTQPRREEPGATGPWYREFECDSLTRIASCI